MTNYLHRARVRAGITIIGGLIENAVSMCDGVRGFLTEIRKIISFSLLVYVLQEVIFLSSQARTIDERLLSSFCLCVAFIWLIKKLHLANGLTEYLSIYLSR